MRGEFAPEQHPGGQKRCRDQRLGSEHPAQCCQREIDRVQAAVETFGGGDIDLGGLTGARGGHRIVEIVGHGGHHDGAIAEQPVRPDEFQQGIGQKGDDDDQLDAQLRGIDADRKILRQSLQRGRIADQRHPAANGDHRGAGKEGGALPQAVDQRNVEDARITGQKLDHPAATVILHEQADRGPPAWRVLGQPADQEPQHDHPNDGDPVKRGQTGFKMDQKVHGQNLAVPALLRQCQIGVGLSSGRSKHRRVSR